MTIEKKRLTIVLAYHRGVSEPDKGIYRGGVVDPEHTDELALWVHPTLGDEADFSDMVTDQEFTVHLGGSARALAELGKYLIALSMHKTVDPHYHDHFDELAKVPNRAPTCLIVHGPIPESSRD